ncbi:TPA: hypothetical protein ACG0NP_001610 [Enterobacter cloacae]
MACALFTALLLGSVETSAALDLSQYNRLDTVGHIVNDSEVNETLRKTLGSDYETFISNKITGSTYKNGDVTYTVTYAPLKLVVSKGGHILVEQSGHWLE